MRVNPNLVPDVLSAMNRTQDEQAQAMQQISTGKRVNVPSDDPACAAALVQNHRRSDAVDQYTQNGNTVLAMLQTAETALNSVVTGINQAITVGTEGANGTLSESVRKSLAGQVSATLNSVVSQANLSYQGIYLFSGTATNTVPFTADGSSPSGYQYNGTGSVNKVAIGDGYNVPVNIPGDQLFQHPGADVLGSLQQLVTALQSGSATAIGDATKQLSTALAYVTQQRVFYGSVASQVNSQETFLQSETVTIKSEENSLVGIDMATAATNFSQAQVASQATMAAAARMLQQTLLDYLK